MSMSKKHFEALASELRRMAAEMEVYGDSPDRVDGVRHAALGVSDVCARFNPNFDRARFLKACGVEEVKRCDPK